MTMIVNDLNDLRKLLKGKKNRPLTIIGNTIFIGTDIDKQGLEYKMNQTPRFKLNISISKDEIELSEGEEDGFVFSQSLNWDINIADMPSSLNQGITL